MKTDESWNYDDLSTMDAFEEQLDAEGIDDWEEGFIRGFQSAA